MVMIAWILCRTKAQRRCSTHCTSPLGIFARKAYCKTVTCEAWSFPMCRPNTQIHWGITLLAIGYDTERTWGREDERTREDTDLFTRVIKVTRTSPSLSILTIPPRKHICILHRTLFTTIHQLWNHCNTCTPPWTPVPSKTPLRKDLV
jgi:hypothetical protein